MKPTHSFGRLAVALLSMSTLASAFSFQEAADSFLGRRADSSSSSSVKSIDSSSINLNTGGLSSDSASESGSSASGKTTGKTTSSSTHSNSTRHTKTYNAQDPAGGVNMITPATTASGLQLYKVGDYVTFGWNYTSLQGTPTAINVLAACTSVTSTYTLTQNMTFQTSASYIWDTAAYQSALANAQLPTQEYTLIIYDADSSVSAVAEAGYLGSFSGFKFGLYQPRTYTSIADGWTCPSCNSALGNANCQAIVFALAMSVITALSFTWFVTGFQAQL